MAEISSFKLQASRSTLRTIDYYDIMIMMLVTVLVWTTWSCYGEMDAANKRVRVAWPHHFPLPLALHLNCPNNGANLAQSSCLYKHRRLWWKFSKSLRVVHVSCKMSGELLFFPSRSREFASQKKRKRHKNKKSIVRKTNSKCMHAMGIYDTII